MKTVLFAALALCVAAPAVASAAEADIVIRTHHRHHYRPAAVINDEGHRLHHRHHGTVAFYDNGERGWRHRHHRRDTLVVTGSIGHRYHHRPVVVDGGSGY